MKKIHFSIHADKRMMEHRQRGIGRADVIRACYRAKEILFKSVPEPLELRGFVANSGRMFTMVVVDVPDGLRIVTVIGTSNGKWKDGKNWREKKVKQRHRNRKGKFRDAF